MSFSIDAARTPPKSSLLFLLFNENVNKQEEAPVGFKIESQVGGWAKLKIKNRAQIKTMMVSETNVFVIQCVTGRFSNHFFGQHLLGYLWVGYKRLSFEVFKSLFMKCWERKTRRAWTSKKSCVFISHFQLVMDNKCASGASLKNNRKFMGIYEGPSGKKGASEDEIYEQMKRFYNLWSFNYSYN